MKNKVCIVTGANSGIGKHTVAGLARQGAQVVMVCRNRDKGFAARENVYQELMQLRPSDNMQIPRIDVLQADLSRPAEIVQLARAIEDQYPQVHVLVNNAGAIFAKREITPEGFEKTFATNHLSYFLLTRLLQDHLTKSSEASGTVSRVVNVASDAHYQIRTRTTDWQFESKYSGVYSYALSKLANILFTYEFARRNTQSGIVMNALHPGVVATDIGTKAGGLVGLFWRLAKPFFISGEKGAATSVFLASNNEIVNAHGCYFAKCKLKKSSPLSRDQDLAASLWNETERLLRNWLV